MKRVVEGLKGGERRTATILFADMKGFSSLSEALDPEEVDALISRIFSAFTSIIERHGGVVEKYIGDALVAVFGVSEVHEDDPKRAVDAALEFLEQVGELSRPISAKVVETAFRIGINTGLVATGVRGEFEVVTGHAMTMAQRLEAEAAPNRVLVSESTREKCSDEFRFGKRQILRVKGASQGFHAYEVLGRAVGEPIGDQGPFVGRKAELDELLRDYVRGGAGDRFGAYILGEAGIGKSRLAQALVDKIRRFPDFSAPVLRARAQKYRTQKYAVVADLVFDYLELETETDAETAARLIRDRLGVAENVAAAFVAVALGKDPSRAAGAVGALFPVFQSILDRHASDVFPVLVLIDNAPHMDRWSRDFFRHFFRTAADRNDAPRPFFVLTGREHPPALRELFGSLKLLRLGPLPEAESRDLVVQLWPDAAAQGLADTIVASGMGNPLFIREYVRFARTNKGGQSLPPTIQNIFLASLDRYSPEERDFLRKMAVFLHSFTLKDALFVQERTGGAAAVVREALDLFVREGVLVKRGDLYLFRLDVFKKALYDSLLNYNKKIIHAQVARLLEFQRKPNRLRLMHHLIRAEEYVAALEALQADPYRHYNYDYLPYLDILLRHFDADDYRSAVSCLINKSALLFNSGKIEEAEQVLKRILGIAVDKRDLSCAGFAYHQLSAYHAISYDAEKARFCGERALSYYAAAGREDRGTLDVLRTLSLSEALRGDRLVSGAYADTLSSLETGDAVERLGAEADVQLIFGEYRLSREAADAMLAELPESDDVPRFFALDASVRILWELCEFRTLKERARELRRLVVVSESAVAQANARLAAACAMTAEGERTEDYFSQAEFYLGQVRNDFDRVDALRTLALSRLVVAGVSAGGPAGGGAETASARYYYRNAVASASATRAELAAKEGLAIAMRHSSFYAAPTFLAILAELAADREDREAAGFFLTEADAFFSARRAYPFKDRAICLYLKWKLSDRKDDASGQLAAEAKAALDEELDRIADTDAIAAFLSTRSFGRAKAELDAAVRSS